MTNRECTEANQQVLKYGAYVKFRRDLQQSRGVVGCGGRGGLPGFARKDMPGSLAPVPARGAALGDDIPARE